SVCAALVHAQVSGVFIMPWSMFLGFWILVLFIGLVWRPKGGISPTDATSVKLWRKSVMGIVTALLLVGTWYSVADYHSRMVERGLVDGGIGKKPRFWIDGRVPVRSWRE